MALFDEMLSWGIKPDVVSCTALITALGTDGQWERAEKVGGWLLWRLWVLLVALCSDRPYLMAPAAVVAAAGHALPCTPGTAR